MLFVVNINGINLNATDDRGATAAAFATEVGKQDLLLLLLEHGADTTIRFDCGECKNFPSAYQVQRVLLHAVPLHHAPDDAARNDVTDLPWTLYSAGEHGLREAALYHKLHDPFGSEHDYPNPDGPIPSSLGWKAATLAVAACACGFVLGRLSRR
jgi:hypothetical protein